MQVLDTYDDLGKILKPGTVLWRSSGIMSMHSPRVEIHDVPFEKTERGSYMARIDFESSTGWCYEPKVWFCDDRRIRPKGLVLFIKELPPDNWLYLVVTGVSKSGSAVFAKHSDCIPNWNQFRSFSLRSYHFMSENLNAPAEQKLALARRAFEECPVDTAEGHHRLAVVGKWNAATEDKLGGYVPVIEYLS